MRFTIELDDEHLAKLDALAAWHEESREAVVQRAAEEGLGILHQVMVYDKQEAAGEDRPVDLDDDLPL